MDEIWILAAQGTMFAAGYDGVNAGYNDYYGYRTIFS